MCWVNDCIAHLLPSVADALRELKIDIVSAQESLTDRMWRRARSDDREPSHYLKTRAMEHIIKKFYKSPGILSRGGLPGGKRSWKNIISIGDSPAERLALQDLVFRRSQRGQRGEWKECHCKTVRLIDEPSLEQLTKEVEIVPKLLQALVCYDGDMHIDVSRSDLEPEPLC